MQTGNRPSLNRQTQLILTIVVAILILAGLGLLARLLSPSEDELVALPTSGPTEDWPTPIPSATATQTPTSLPPAPPTETPTPVPSPTPIVIGSFQELGELITVEYTLQTVVEAQRERVFPLSPERIILVAVGNVEAGVDLTQIQDDDIVIDGTSVSITLPPAHVTSVELLPSESEIFDSNRGWLLSDYDGLELEAMNKARNQLELWAVNRVNLLDQAEIEAVDQMKVFLQKLGFQEIEVVFE